MSNERLIISNILYHNDKRHYLPRINLNWFEDTLCKKIVGVITQMYLNNEAIDYLTLIPHFERKELIDVITLQQNASDIDLRTHLLTLEYNYIKRNLVYRLTHLDLSNELPDMVKDIQSILEETTFSTHITYEVTCHGQSADFFTTIAERKLNLLDFSELSSIKFNRNNFVLVQI